eukprot:scaffold1881_cov256-Pinguiococcus_pyrenoidosus.AAC.19
MRERESLHPTEGLCSSAAAPGRLRPLGTNPARPRSSRGGRHDPKRVAHDSAPGPPGLLAASSGFRRSRSMMWRPFLASCRGRSVHVLLDCTARRVLEPPAEDDPNRSASPSKERAAFEALASRRIENRRELFDLHRCGLASRLLLRQFSSQRTRAVAPRRTPAGATPREMQLLPSRRLWDGLSAVARARQGSGALWAPDAARRIDASRLWFAPLCFVPNPRRQSRCDFASARLRQKRRQSRERSLQRRARRRREIRSLLGGL